MLVNKNLEIKIIDFGLSFEVSDNNPLPLGLPGQASLLREWIYSQDLIDG